jgi:hypothetical protein
MKLEQNEAIIFMSKKQPARTTMIPFYEWARDISGIINKDTNKLIDFKEYYFDFFKNITSKKPKIKKTTSDIKSTKQENDDFKKKVRTKIKELQLESQKDEEE